MKKSSTTISEGNNNEDNNNENNNSDRSKNRSNYHDDKIDNKNQNQVDEIQVEDKKTQNENKYSSVLETWGKLIHCIMYCIIVCNLDSSNSSKVIMVSGSRCPIDIS